jgi:large subunit ribosomal protein L19e
MNVTAQKRMASEILKCGLHRVYIEPNYVDEVNMAITREDIRNLIQQGIIKKRQKIGISKYRTNLNRLRKKRGRARGFGKRKGVAGARHPSKRAWINTIRPLRRELKQLRDTGKIERKVYRKMYLRAKGGSFKSVATLQRYLKEQKLIKK